MSGDDRAVRRAAELAARELGVEVVRAEPVAPGLGTRRFFRLHLSGAPGRVVARVEGPEDPERLRSGVPPEPALEPLRSFLEERGLPVPRSFGRDAEAGIDLLEDVGDETLEARARRAPPAERRALYAEACALPARLQALDAPADAVPAFGRRLDERFLAAKEELLVGWGLPWALGRPLAAAEREAVRTAFGALAEHCREAPARLAHRDFKAANLHLRPGAPAGERLVMIDLQGAFLAPPEYDLVCLLRDAHVGLPEEEVAAQLRAVRPRLPRAPGAADLERRFHLLTLARVGKDLSLFLWAADRRGDRRYLPHVPAAARSLRAAAGPAARAEPRVAGLAELLAQLPEAPCGR